MNQIFKYAIINLETRYWIIIKNLLLLVCKKIISLLTKLIKFKILKFQEIWIDNYKDNRI